MASRSLCSFYRDEINGDANENNADGKKIDNSKSITRKYFKYKTKIKEIIPDDNNTLNAEVELFE